MEGEPSSDASSANTPANRSETPVRTKATQSPSYMEGNLAAARRAVMKELGTTIPQVSTEFFQTHLLPPLPVGVNINQLVNNLRARKYIKGKRWAAFRKDPKDARGKENVCFRSLKRVADAIEEVAVKMTGEEPQFAFVQNPNSAPESSTRTSKSRPDGCFIRKSGPKGRFRWMDIAVSAEYKKMENTTTRDDDVQKIVWSMHHCMREDARRRFTYGLTIENKTMRMWFCSRTELLVSEPINFILQHHKVVHFFVAMMYAAEHEAGWDPTIQYVWKNDKKNGELVLDDDDDPRLDIDVQDGNGKVVRYRTIRWLSDDGANGLRGRGTRVWEVCILSDDGEEGVDRFALKDQWIDADRQREGMIIYQLRNAKTSDAAKRVIEQSLLTVEHHGDVYVEGMLDHTRNLMTRRGEPRSRIRFKLQELPENGVKETTAAKATKRTQAGVGHYQSPEELTTPSVEKVETYHPKVHYRIVFKEVCKPIHEYTSLKDVFDILVNAVVVLLILHELGWVHRDISIGNLLGFIINGVLYCKLSDLEYAKPMDDRLGHEIRTGTRSFMSVEVNDMEYCFLPSESQEANADGAKPFPSVANPTQDQMKSIELAIDRAESMRCGNPEKIVVPIRKVGPIVPFRYNPLHDIESLWWVAIYFVFNRSVVQVGGEPPSMDVSQRGSYNAQKEYTELLTTSPQKRQSALGNERTLQNQIIHLHAAIREIAYDLNQIRAQLVSCYREAEKNLGGIHHRIGHDLLQSAFLTHFGQSLRKLQNKDIQIDILRNDPRQRVEDGVTDDNGPADDDDTEENSNEGDQGSGLADLTREVSVGDMTEEATAKDGAKAVVVEDPDAGRSVSKATESSVPQTLTEPLVEGRSTRPQRKRAPPVRYGAESNVKKGTTSKTASSSSTPTTATQTATGQSTSGTTSSTKKKVKAKSKSKSKSKGSSALNTLIKVAVSHTRDKKRDLRPDACDHARHRALWFPANRPSSSSTNLVAHRFRTSRTRRAPSRSSRYSERKNDRRDHLQQLFSPADDRRCRSPSAKAQPEYLCRWKIGKFGAACKR
ncbi:hypothetical protein IEO21_08711 [Rhodonia placenta]|uniref:Fungal-type protein kinase domain-containing protein n=1 Tax=Rhodonia placenta TaxID=104341 RepID=A0A8H7NVR2_9APHY|nr:hypothetical protein IEO21_08711 [Postia placenta]